MSPELDALICRSFPNLYRDRHAPMTETCMCWGFDVSLGWLALIWNLSAELEKLILALPEEERQHCKASQVKSKFAGLRYYMSSQTEEMDKLIEKFEDASYKICEDCGCPGEVRRGGWLVTQCDGCWKATQERRAALMVPAPIIT